MKKFILVVPSNEKERLFINKYYINKLRLFNKPYYICDYNIKSIEYEYIAGIILTGGGDINPDIYGQKKHHKTNNICDERDIFEIELLKNAFKRKIPTFAICRGIQIMNVAFGGTLNQHIDGHSQKEDKTIPTHYVDIDKSSTLYEIVNKSKIKVNSVHHQVIDKVATGFKVCAMCENVIEAIEYIDKDRFLLGVQWHPEALYDENSKNIFQYFLEITK